MVSGDRETSPLLDAELAAAVRANDARSLLAMAAGAELVTDTEATSLFLAIGMVGGRLILDPSTPTAAIVREAEDYHILMGPSFLLSTVLTVEDLAYLLLHEIVHFVLGHPSEMARMRWRHPPRPDRRGESDGLALEAELRFESMVANIAADLLVAKFLHLKIGRTPGLDFRVHGDGTPLWNALMATPETVLKKRWLPGQTLPRGEVATAFEKRASEDGPKCPPETISRLAELYSSAWNEGLALNELTDDLTPLLRPWAQCLNPPLRLIAKPAPPGTYTESHPGELGRCLPAGWREALINARHGEWDDPDGGGPAGHSQHVQSIALRDRASTEKVEAAAALLRKLLTAKTIMKIHDQATVVSERRTPVPLALGKKEALWIAAGVSPVSYPDRQGRRLDQGPLSVYVDVSGSTHACWSIVVDALRKVIPGRAITTFQFSNVVRKLALGDSLSSLETTLGTDFDCVVRHALGTSDAFIITDGFASLDAAVRKQASATRSRFHIILLSERSVHLEETIRRTFDGLLAGEGGILWLPWRQLVR